MPHAATRVLPDSIVYTDEWKSYNKLAEKGYYHQRTRRA